MSRPQAIDSVSLAARDHGLQNYHRRIHPIWTQETQQGKLLNLVTFTTQQLSEYSYT